MGRLFIATERVIVGALVVMMTLIIVLATVNLGWTIGRSLVTPPLLLPEVHELLDTFNAFLVVLIGLELLDTVRGYLSEHVVRVELVLDVALIAVARKVIVLKLKPDGTLTVFGIAALVIALAGARFLVRHPRSGIPRG